MRNNQCVNMKHYLLSIVALLLSVAAFGQGSTTAAISGQVKDDTGQTLPGATVIAVHLPTGSQYGAVTSVDGFYRISNLQVGGPYKVQISFVGYQTIEKTDISLALGQNLAINVILSESAEQLDEVVVTASGRDIIDGDRTGAKTVVGEEEIQAMPTASRDLSDFLRLTPQANLGESNDGPNISIAGQNNRFNSVFIDGAVNNDVFGLSGSGANGGQTGISPISIDAIEEFQVTISPYDVTLGGFTGGGINAVTRRGTNNFEGSAYYFMRNESLSGKTPTDTEGADRVRLNPFNARTYGMRVGGPVIKDKLFFFTNVELQRDEESQPTNLGQYRGEVFNADFLDQLRTYVNENYNYDIGEWRDNVRERKGNKILGKLDYNLNQNHKFSFRHSYTYAEETERNQSGSNQINFSNNAEFFPSITNSTALEWRGNFGNNMSNKLILGYTAVRDDRDIVSNPFPRVTINDGRNGRVTFGSEPFSVGNVLNQDVFTLTNNFNLFAGKHALTFGTHNEFYKIYNLFLRENYGVYTFDNVSLYSNKDAVSGEYTDVRFNELFADGVEEYVRSYALLPTPDAQLGDDASDIAAQFKAMQLGFYVQDEYQMTDRLKLNAGVRVDIPLFLNDPNSNSTFNAETLPLIDRYYDLDGARSGSVPSSQILFSPRFGFNWDVEGNQKYQVRGGMGIFTGRIPFVWPGGSYTNNGVFVASINAERDDFPGGTLAFRPDVNNQYVGSDFGLSGNPSQIDLFSENFKYPQVFRTSLAADFSLPYGIVGTLEGIFTKNINQIYYQNVNIKPAEVVLGQYVDALGNIRVEGPDNRPVYGTGVTKRDIDGNPTAWGRIDNKIDDRFDRVLLAKNTNEGYSYNLTASLSKPFSNGFVTSASYTFGRSITLIDGTSSQNSSNWRNQEVVDRNDMRTGFSDFDMGHRINAFVSYKFDWAKLNLPYSATTVSLFYNGQTGQPFSYVYTRGPGSLFDVTGARGIGGDDEAGRDFNWLPFVPASLDQINLIPITDDDGNEVYSVQDQWEALNAYIEADDHLSDRRGQYAEMNGGRLPFQHTLDLKFIQDFYIKVGDKKNTLQLTFDVFNFTNLLNKDWGRRRFLDFGTVNFVEFAGYQDPDNGDYRPTFQFDPETRNARDNSSIDDTGIYSSRWQGQVGIRYIFGN